MSETTHRPEFEIQPVGPPTATITVASRRGQEDLDVDVELDGFDEPEEMRAVISTVSEWISAAKGLIDAANEIIGDGGGGGGGGGDVTIHCTNCNVTVNQ